MACGGGGGDDPVVPVGPVVTGSVEGGYESTCLNVSSTSAAPELGLRVRADLSGTTLSLRTAYFTSASCAGTAFAVVTPPPSTLTPHGSKSVTAPGGGTVDALKLVLSSPAGPSTGTGSVRVLENGTVQVLYPADQQVYISLAPSAAKESKELVAVVGTSLYFGNGATLDADGYPIGLLPDGFGKRP